MEKGKAYTQNQLLHLTVSLFFMFIFGLVCPLWGGITRQGVQAIGIFVGGIWLIANRFGMIVPSFLIMFSMILTGYTDAATVISTTLGSPTVWQLIVIFVLLYALTESGADSVLARWMISRKALNGRPVLFTCVFMVAVTVLGALASSLGSFLFSVAMVNSIGDSVGYDNKSQWKKAMTTGALIASSVGGGILPFKGMALMIYNLLASGIVEAGLEINQVSYMASAALSGLFISVSFALCLKPLFRVDFTKLKHVDIAAICGNGGTRFNKKQSFTFGIFLLGIAYSIVMIWLPKSIYGYEIINAVGQGFWFVLMVVILGLVHIDGEPLFDVERSMGKSVNWGIVLCVCAFTAIGGMISNEALGIRGWLSGIMNVVFGNMPFPVFVLVLVAATLICTNVFSNTATAVIIGTVVGPFLIDYGLNLGINPSCIIPAIVMTALCAFLTMAAGGSAPLYLGADCMKEDPKWVWSYGLLIFPIVTATSSAAYILCAYLM